MPLPDQATNFLTHRQAIEQAIKEIQAEMDEVPQNAQVEPTCHFWDFDEVELVSQASENIHCLLADSQIGVKGTLNAFEEAIVYQASAYFRAAQHSDDPAKKEAYRLEATRLKVLQQGIITLREVYENSLTTLADCKKQLELEEKERQCA